MAKTRYEGLTNDKNWGSQTRCSEDDTMTADEEDDRKLPATAGAGQSMSEMCPTNILSVSAQDNHGSMCFFHLVRT